MQGPGYVVDEQDIPIKIVQGVMLSHRLQGQKDCFLYCIVLYLLCVHQIHTR